MDLKTATRRTAWTLISLGIVLILVAVFVLIRNRPLYYPIDYFQFLQALQMAIGLFAIWIGRDMLKQNKKKNENDNHGNKI